MNLLFLLLIACIAMVAYGRDLKLTSTKSQLKISPTNIQMDLEGKNRINNNNKLYSQKNTAAEAPYDAVNKIWTRNISTKKVKEPNKTNANENNQNRIVNNTIVTKYSLVNPILRQCPEGTVRVFNKAECVLKFSDD